MSCIAAGLTVAQQLHPSSETAVVPALLDQHVAFVGLPYLR